MILWLGRSDAFVFGLTGFVAGFTLAALILIYPTRERAK